MARKPDPDSRFAINQSVRLSVLSETPVSLLGQLRHLGATGAELALDRPAEPGVLCKIRWNHAVLFGEVISCQWHRGDYHVELRLWHVIFEAPQAAEGWTNLFGEPAPQRGSGS
jgi:hypothetical protein